MAKKPIDPLKAKEKKQKKILAVLGILFIGLMFFQVPRLMKQLNPPAPPEQGTETSATPTPGSPTLVAPTLRGADQGTTEPAGSLVSADGTAVQEGQLASFSRFASKDPFSQQLSDDSGSSTSGGGTSSGGSSSGPGPSTADPTIPDIPGNSPVPGSAIISLNGTLYTVPTGTDFPQSSATDPTIVPLFHLVSLTAHTAKISIVGGAYSNGARTVTLREKRPVTLVNTADGTRYKLVLMPLGTQVPTDDGGSTDNPTTVTLPPATP
jgi:hypothetical protein